MPTKGLSRVSTVIATGMLMIMSTGTPMVEAQSREGTWEFSLGAVYQLGADIDVESGSSIDTDDSFGFILGGGYNFTDRLATTFGLEWTGVDYGATAVDPETDEPIGVSGGYDQFVLSGNLVWNLMDGPIVPYVGVGIGWTWIDTNIPNGPPYTWCWWDPWWGYVCSTTYPTESVDAFSYQALLGVRYEFDNDRTFMRFGYTSRWMEFSGTSGTPRFDVIALDVGWMF